MRAPSRPRPEPVPGADPCTFPAAVASSCIPRRCPAASASATSGPRRAAFVDFLAEAGQSLWQVLPLGPTGYGDSPYQCFSAFAGNPLLVSLEALARGRPARRRATSPRRRRSRRTHVDFGAVIPWKRGAARARRRALSRRTPAAPLRAEFDAVVRARTRRGSTTSRSSWRSRTRTAARAWSDWPAPLRRREAAALAAAREPARGRHARAPLRALGVLPPVGRAARVRAREGRRDHGRRADLRGLRQRRRLGAARAVPPRRQAAGPRVVAGVPPDYFSETGQLWGNPLYRWDTLADEGYAWWIARAARRCSRWSTACGSTTSSASRAAGRCPPTRPTRAQGRFAPGPGRGALRGARARAGRPADRGRGPGRASRPRSRRCATASRFPA